MDINLTEVIREHMKRGAPPYKLGKEFTLKMCEKLGITTIDQFYDVLFDSLRCGCSKNFWQHLQGICMDGEGSHIAYGKEEIGKALGKNPKDLTCEDICYTCGSCAHINQIDHAIFMYLAEMMDDRGIKLDETQNS